MWPPHTHTPLPEVLVQGLELLGGQLREQAREARHPLLAVPNQRLLQRAAVDAQEAHVGRRVLALHP